MHFILSFEKVQLKCSRFHQNKRNLKANAETIFKIIVTIFSICGLLYQVQIIYNQFMSGKTTISLEIGRLPDETTPAVTICFPRLFSMERAGKFKTGYREINELYQELLRNNSVEEYIKLYSKNFRKYTDENLNKNDLDMYEMFDKMSVKYKDLDGNYMFEMIITEKNESNTKPSLKYYEDEPLETIVIRQMEKNIESQDETKCFTHYSHTQVKFRLPDLINAMERCGERNRLIGFSCGQQFVITRQIAFKTIIIFLRFVLLSTRLLKK